MVTEKENSESYVTTWILFLHKNMFGQKHDTLMLSFAPDKDMIGKQIVQKGIILSIIKHSYRPLKSWPLLLPESGTPCSHPSERREAILLISMG